MYRILLIDDQKDVHMMLDEAFFGEVVLNSAFSLSEAHALLSGNKYDLVLLDIGLPDGDGLDFYASLKNRNILRDTPVVFLTGNRNHSAMSIGFSLGADDYIRKPFDPVEVKLRCLARIKKTSEKVDQEKQIFIGDFRIEKSSQQIFKKAHGKEQPLELTPTGFKLLRFLLTNHGKIFSRNQIIDEIWGVGRFIAERTVDTHVALIRKQLVGTDVIITSVHGQGYQLILQGSGSQSERKRA